MRTIKSITVGDRVAAIAQEKAAVARVPLTVGGHLLPSIEEYVVNLVHSLAPRYGLAEAEVEYAKSYALSKLAGGLVDAAL